MTAFQLLMGWSLKKFAMHEMLCNACSVGGCSALRQSGQLWECGGVCSAAGCLVTELSQLTGACNSWHSSAQASGEKLHHQPLSGQYGYWQLFYSIDIGPAKRAHDVASAISLPLNRSCQRNLCSRLYLRSRLKNPSLLLTYVCGQGLLIHLTNICQ